MKIHSKHIFLLSFLTFGTLYCSKSQPIQLFNKTDLSGWHIDVPAMDSLSDIRNPFLVRNGNLVSLETPAGHIITDQSYKNYRLYIRYRFVNGPGNGGVMVHVSTPRVLNGMFPKSVEVQLMFGDAGDFWCISEDITVPDMEQRRGIDGEERRILNLTDDSEKPPGEWNDMIIECFDDQIKVLVNGDLVNYGFDCTVQQGQIAFQAEGTEMEFNRIELTPISKLSDY